MHDESLEPLSEQERRELEERNLDHRIVAALEQPPDLSAAIPNDFAARVAAKVPAKRPVTVRATNYGRRAMWFGLIVLLAAIVIFSSQRADQSIAIIAVECLLVAQFLAIITWLSLRSSREG
jgi:hypothetical protein